MAEPNQYKSPKTLKVLVKKFYDNLVILAERELNAFFVKKKNFSANLAAEDIIHSIYLKALKRNPLFNSKAEFFAFFKKAIKYYLLNAKKAHSHMLTDSLDAKNDEEEGEHTPHIAFRLKDSSISSNPEEQLLFIERIEQLKITAGKNMNVVQLIDAIMEAGGKNEDLVEVTGWGERKVKLVKRQLAKIVTKQRRSIKLRKRKELNGRHTNEKLYQLPRKYAGK